MKIGVGILIFFVALIALVAEIILYFIFGLGAAFSGNVSSVGGIAAFFVWLMIMTVVIGVASPIAALIEQLTKKQNISIYILLPTVGLIGVGLGAILLVGSYKVNQYSQNKSVAPSNQSSNSSNTAVVTSDAGSQSSDAGSQYIDKIQIRNLEVSTTVLREPGVFGELKNTGDRTVKTVDITIYFLDKSGNVVAEKEHSPIFQTEYNFGEHDSSPLKPNHSRKFGYKADDAPSDWARKVKAKVTKVEFE
jgi:hypothetical protein